MSGNENEKIKQSLPKIGIYSLEGSLFEKWLNCLIWLGSLPQPSQAPEWLLASIKLGPVGSTYLLNVYLCICRYYTIVKKKPPVIPNTCLYKANLVIVPTGSLNPTRTFVTFIVEIRSVDLMWVESIYWSSMTYYTSCPYSVSHEG
jgi:hypothetical protein